ncbi:DUF4870 domain-containing protein [Bacillus sinesaloumensis]|uniref:DUF4870 domain-containing protein n=1 Tax=Litchfieldia sinesaloumensis TaxID=1926280 RepID=UPI0009887FF3|nr:DUF4870 domain-containing protein [Bacillus sinesaloumensis]
MDEEKKNQEPQNQDKTSTGLTDNVAGLLSYVLGPITGIIFLVIEKENRFVRFHALQSIFVFVAIFIITTVLSFIPIIGWLISLIASPLSLVLWILLMYQAYQGKWYKLPVVGDIVEQQLKK